MADNPDATATSSAPPAASAPGTGDPALSNPRTPEAPKELDLNSDFDVESMFMAGEAAPAAEPTNEEGATDDETHPEELGDPAEELPASEEAEEAAATEEAETTEETEQPDAEVLKALKPKAIKRFNQMLSQRDEALREAREAKAERDALKARSEQPKDEPQALIKTGDPLARVTNEEQLEAHENYYRSVRSWCRSHPNGGVPPVELTGGREVEMDAEQVGRKLDEYESLLEAVPKRRELLTAFKAERAKVREAMPDMFKAGTPENTAHASYQRKLLNFDTQADQDDIIRKLIKVDRMEREEREGIHYTRVETKKVTPATTAQPGTPKPAPKPAPTAARTPVVRPAGARTPQQAAMDRLNAPRGEIDVEELLAEA